MVRTQHCHCQGVASIPGQVAKIPQAVWWPGVAGGAGSGRGKQKRSEGCGVRTPTVVAGLEDEGRDHKSRNAGSLYVLGRAKHTFSPTASGKKEALPTPCYQPTGTMLDL